ncbi:DNA polymerase III subunit epsilon [Cryobacterium adonitolivorans]|uniref:DNA polymerase III subunit epsilon n=1 Tax=Cryobacterium adonitolivorans TaxID=1259189 RepID=A0A4R8W7E3_9MICO|nr:exonuclease domain-containing protein [Cryobacterium adonitolivorans]TFC01693.1 DNA polymerase III subunit epsilon [Cryobacterium adonitolivorans]
MAGPGFAVIDFETTGLIPAHNDRVIELAVVHVSDRGLIEGRWETLVNPGRDLGRQDIHRIRAADVLDAPTFAEIAPRLVELLRGRVVVAHNASFDIRFLLAELNRAGRALPAEIVSLCTMQLARDFLPGAGRSLADCCAALDIDLDGAHRASVDALATARLLAAYIEAADAPEFWFAHLTAAAAQSWPAGEDSAVAWCARTVSSHPMTADSFLERITTRLPDVAGPAEYVDYLALLDRCLLDRALSVHEAQSLVRLAGELGLGRATCEALHREYFAALTTLAWSDGILTGAELADLVSVGMLLGLPTETIAAALDETRQQTQAPAVAVPAGPGLVLLAGDLVVLTGEMSRTRSELERELRETGLVPWRAVTKKVKLLVAADPDSLSGKARKARDYGIPIVDEATLARLSGARFAGA